MLPAGDKPSRARALGHRATPDRDNAGNSSSPGDAGTALGASTPAGPARPWQMSGNPGNRAPDPLSAPHQPDWLAPH